MTQTRESVYLNCQCHLCGEMASILFSEPIDTVIHAGCPAAPAARDVHGIWRPMMEFTSTPRFGKQKAEQEAKRAAESDKYPYGGQLRVERQEADPETAELERLREQNAALQLNEHDLEKENERLKTAQTACGKAAGIIVSSLQEENRRLKSELGDLRGKESFRAAAHAYVLRELAFAKAEVARHDPRLAKVRWGI